MSLSSCFTYSTLASISSRTSSPSVLSSARPAIGPRRARSRGVYVRLNSSDPATSTATSTAMQKYNANAVPMTYVIDRAGKIAMALGEAITPYTV